MKNCVKRIKLQERKFNSLSDRERFLASITVIAVIYYIWQLLAFNPLDMRYKETSEHINSIKQQIVKLETQKRVNDELFLIDRKANLKNTLTSLKNTSKQYENNINSRVRSLITPEEMIALLQEILERNNDVVLVNMENLSEEPLFEHKEDEPKIIKNMQAYKHTLRIEFNGTYFATVHFLQELEKFKDKLFWHSFTYKVKNYPLASVELMVHTLNFQQEYIGL